MQNAAIGNAATPESQKAKPHKVLRRIGSTNYEVSVRFSETSKETLEDKIFRLMEREVKTLPLNVPQNTVTAGTEEL